MFSSSFATRFLAPALLALCAVSPAVRAQALVDTLERTDSQAAVGFPVGSNFGASVAISGSYAVVGEPGFRRAGLGFAGRVVVYERDAQGHWHDFALFDGDVFDGTLGQSVAIATPAPGEITVIAGAPGAHSARQWVYLASVNTWTSAPLTPPAGVPNGDFGWSVATNGLDFVVGQPHREGGYIHMYRRAAGAQFVGYWNSVFEVSVGGAAGEYGYAVALTSDRLVVGAPSYVEIDGFHPSAFVYRKQASGNWTFENVLSWAYAGGLYSLGFGKSVAIDGSRIVVGAPDTAGGIGRAVSFTRSGSNWPQERVFEGSAAAGHFGRAVGVRGTSVAASRVGPSLSGLQDVSIYDATTGSLVRWLQSPPTLASDYQFGAALALDASQVLIGNPTKDTGRGAVYVFLWAGADCNGNSRGDPSDIFLGLSADVNADGVPDECQSPTCRLEELNASNGVAGDQLGWSIAADGDRVISGAFTKTSAGGLAYAGAAYVYRRDGTHLVQEAVLTSPTPRANATFGRSVAIRGDLAFCGAPGDDSAGPAAGAVYVFRRDASNVWTFLVRLLPPAITAGLQYGISLACAPDLGDVLLVGAAGTIGLSGRVYVHQHTGGTSWSLQNTLFGPAPTDNDQFGASVAVSGSLVAVGAPYADVGSFVDAGRAYWAVLGAPLTTPVTLTALSPWGAVAAGSHLGASLAVSPGARIAVGAPADPFAGHLAGSVWVFEPLAVPALDYFALRLAGANDWDSFGLSVAWAGERLVVGVPFIDTVYAQGAGMCVTYQIHDWGFVENGRSWALDGNYNQAFGGSVAWSDGLLAVGAYGDDVPNGADSGSVYALGLAGADCNGNLACDFCDIRAGTLADVGNNGVPDVCELSLFCFGDGSGAPCPCGNNAPAQSGGCKNSFGLAGRLDYAGVPSVANDTFVFTASDLPATSTALFFQGTGAENQGAGNTFADGVRCVTGSLVRLRTRVANAGFATYPIAGDPLVHVRGNCVPGDTRYYQVNYRNSASTYCTSATMNYTNGIAVVWQP